MRETVADKTFKRVVVNMFKCFFFFKNKLNEERNYKNESSKNTRVEKIQCLKYIHQTRNSQTYL